MEVTIKVLANSEAIEKAKAENQKKASERQAESQSQKPKNKRVEILDVEVPEKELKNQPMWLNGNDIKWATISQNNMIFICLEDGYKFECLRDEAIEKRIAEILTQKENQLH